MVNQIFQSSLFLNKGDFQKDEFQKIVTPTFKHWLLNGITTAWREVNNVDKTISKRLKADNMHEYAFCNLQNASATMPDFDVRFSQSIPGNQRLYFLYEGYIFLLKKKNASINNTGITKKIYAQEACNHVIHIEYGLDITGESVQSISLRYYLGKNAIYSYNISTTETVNINNIENQNPVIEATKPRLLKATIKVSSEG